MSTRVQRVLCLADGDKPAAVTFLAELVDWLRACGLEAEGRDTVRTIDKEPPPEPRPDLVLVLGGDGAILGAVRAFQSDPIPIMGINFGYLGFLSGTPSGQAFEVLDQILSGELVPEMRMRLVAKITTDRSDEVRTAVALNDMVLQRGVHQSLLVTSLSVGDDWVTNLRGDGLIVATPSGSTAYSLAAGGPVVEPSMRCFLMTPLASQGLANRPIVLDADAELVLEVLEAQGITTMAVDGQGYYPLETGARVEISRHPVAYPLYSMPDLDPYRRLRERLGWSQLLPGQEYARRHKPRREDHEGRDTGIY